MTVNQIVSDETVDERVIAARTCSDAFGKLFDQFYPSIFAYCKRRLVLRSVAEDVTSEVFLKVAGNIRDFPGTREQDFCRWLFRIATNEINAHLRQTIRRRELLEAAVQLGHIDASLCTKLLETDWPVSWEDVYQELLGLSDREQSIISLRFFAGHKHEQIAEVLEMKPASIRVALSRALDKLRDRLRSSGDSRSTPNVGGSNHE